MAVDITHEALSKRTVGDSGLIHDDSIIEVGVATEIRLISVNDAEETFKVALLIHCHFKPSDVPIVEDETARDENFWKSQKAKFHVAHDDFPDAYERVDDYELYVPKLTMVNTVATQLEEFAETVRFNRKTGVVWVSYYNTCEISESLELEKFPFDRQLFRVTFKSANAKLRNWSVPTNVLDFPPVRNKNATSEQIFATHLVACELKNWFMKGFFVEYFPEDDDPASLTQGEFGITIKAERDPKFYFFNFYFVIYLIVLSNVTLVSVSPEDSGDRHAITITLLLTLVAFKFVLIDGTPKVGYLTYMDKYVLLSYLFTMAAMIENIFISPLVTCRTNGNFDCDNDVDLAKLVSDAQDTDAVFHIIFGVFWSVINLGMAIMCFFPSLVRFTWETVIDGQIGQTDDTMQRTNVIIDGNAAEEEKMKRLGIGSARKAPVEDEEVPPAQVEIAATSDRKDEV